MNVGRQEFGLSSLAVTSMIMVKGKEIQVEERLYTEEDEDKIKESYLRCIGVNKKSRFEKSVQFYTSKELAMNSKNIKEHIYMVTGRVLFNF